MFHKDDWYTLRTQSVVLLYMIDSCN